MQAFFKDTEYTSDSYAGYYGGYIAAITDPNGVKLEAATKERPYSGWMYTRNGEYADAINAEFVEDGDKIYFYYTVNYYLELDENSDEVQGVGRRRGQQDPCDSRRDLERQCRSV